MKIQKLSVENRPKAYALLERAFTGSKTEVKVVKKLHDNGKLVHEWVCIHIGKVIAYIAFTNAYHGSEICGLHLAPLAVAPELQKQGVGSELLRFALRQNEIKSQTLYSLGAAGFFKRFDFEPCSAPSCSFAKNNANFLSLRNTHTTNFVVEYEAEFKTVSKPTKQPEPSRPGKSKGRKRR